MGGATLPSAGMPETAPYGKPEMKDPAARGDREHSFQIGNDRFVLVGSNYGTWRLRADEGGPKFLNDADVDNSSGWRFGGGLGYLFAPNGTAPLLSSASQITLAPLGPKPLSPRSSSAKS